MASLPLNPQLNTVSAYGRKWKLTIVTNPDSDGNALVIETGTETSPEGLQISFDVYQPGYMAFWYGDISIYNFDLSTTNVVLTEGMKVILEAGYINGQYGQIFSGRLFQPFVERENVTDFKTTLHCIIGLPEMVKNLISFTSGPNVTDQDLAIAYASRATTALSLKYIQGTLDNKTQLPRGRVVFGDPQRYFDEITKDNNLVWWYDGSNVNASDFNTPDPNALEFSPTTGLIGTPQQTEQGVAMRFLLNPQIVVKLNPVQIKLDMSSIRIQKQLLGQNPSILDQDGLYVVGAVRHIGDSRGNDWYTDVIGYTTIGGQLGMLGATQQIIQNAKQQLIDTW